MGFPQSVAEKALVACGRCCCICHVFCGTKIELHHINRKALAVVTILIIASLCALIAMPKWENQHIIRGGDTMRRN